MEYNELTYDELLQENNRLKEQLARKQFPETSKNEDADHLLDMVPDIIVEVSNDGYFKRVNKACLKILGYKPEEMLNHHYSQFIYPDDILATVENLTSQLMEKGSAIYINRYQCKKGGYRWLEWVTTYTKDKDELYGIARDITERIEMEREMFSVSAKLEAAMESMSDAVFISDTEGNFINFNEAFATFHKFRSKAECAKTLKEYPAFLNVYYPNGELAPLENWAVPRALRGEVGIEAEYHLERIDTGEKWIGSYNFAPIYNSKGVIVGSVVTGRDITAWKEAENQLRQAKEKAERNEKLMRDLINNSPSFIYILDLEGRLVELNQPLLKMFGKPREELIGKKRHEILPAKIAEQHIDNDQKVIETGQPWTFEEENEEPDKKRKYLTVKFPLFDHLDNMYGIAGISADITEKKFMEKQLNDRLSQLNSILSNAPLILTVIDVNGNFILSEGKGLEKIGRKPGQTEGLNIYMMYKDRPDMIGHIENTFKGLSHKETIKINDEIFEASFEPFYDNKHNIIGAIGVSNCVTEQFQMTQELIMKNHEYEAINEELRQTNDELFRAKEKAEESDSLKTAFLQNMSHEIRTPMNAIMGFAELLPKKFDDKEKLSFFSKVIYQRCNDLLDIINDILDIAKIESGQLPVYIENCHISGLLTELDTFFKEYQVRINKPQIRFGIEAQCDLTDVTLNTDRVKLRQIFTNLISNAFKFTHQGKITGGCKFDDNHQLIFYVSDTGIGIPKDKHEKIFERFIQLETGGARVYGGTGLGLSIVKGLIHLLGGKIWLESEPGVGTTFYFTIENLKASDTKRNQSKEKTNVQEYHFAGKTVLIVEDDVYNAELMKEILTDTGINLIYAETGEEAIRKTFDHQPDIILMDIRLPDASGFEITQEILKSFPEMKIIAQTAYASGDDREKAIASGCVEYISKPIKKFLFLGLLEKFLNK